MVYDRLNKALDDLSLGNGAIYGLSDFIGGARLTCDIKRYTIDRGFYLNNITKNYEGGFNGRYSYGTADYTEGNGREKIEGTDGVYLGMDGQIHPVPHYADRVGDFYGINGTERNSFKKFTTVAEFSALGEEIRNLNLADNVNEDTFRRRYNSEKFFGGNIDSNYIGEDYINTYKTAVYQDLFGNRLPLEDTMGYYREKNLNNNNSVFKSQGIDTDSDDFKQMYSSEMQTERPIYQGETNVFHLPNKLTTMLTKGAESRNFLASINFRDNKFYAESPEAKAKPYYGQDVDAYKTFLNLWEFYDKNDEKASNATLVFKSSIGLYDFYEPLRNSYGKGTKKDAYGKAVKNTYWYGKSSAYANFSTTQQGEKYIVGNKWGVSNVSIDHTFTDGSFRTDSHATKSGTYTYYQERDKGSGASSLGETNTFPDFFPSIGSFDSGSEIMRRMNEKFANNEIKSLINRFHTDASEVDKDDQLISAYDPNFGLSRGRNLVRKEFEGRNYGDKSSGFDNPYCRVWTAHHQYSKLKDRIRPFMENGTFMSIKELQSNLGKLRPNNGAQRLNDYSTLQENGFVKVTPFHDGKNLAGGRESLKRYMFSIENLAWKGFATTDRLSNEQIGPFGGRIMWFPPYNLKFTENINTSWKDNDFIGRGEKIYTYVNTDRSGTLSFTILIDHPSILDKAVASKENGATEEDVLRFFAGCGPLEVSDPEEEPQPENEVGIDEDNIDNTTPMMNPDAQYIETKFIVFYPNNFSAKKYYSNMDELVEHLDEYEMGGNAGDIFTEMDTAWANQILKPMNYDNTSEYNLNSGDWSDSVRDRIGMLLDVDPYEILPYSQLKRLDDYYSLTKDDGSTTIFGYNSSSFELDSIIVEGHASDHGYPDANLILAKDRANTMAHLVKHFCGRVDNDKISTGYCSEIQITKPTMEEDVNDLDAKIARCSIVTFRLKLKDDAVPSMDYSDYEDGRHYQRLTPDNEPVQNAEESSTTKNMYVATSFHGEDGNPQYTYQNEYMYFKELKSSDALVYKNIIRKVQFFDPAYHSLTPEGFNARLNFLQQCTRQGPTVASHNGGENKDTSNYSNMAGNLSFGMAPYCILRIGDFYYSKIVIDSISIDYDNGGGTQWDLNPEGVGVQPMLANVNMNFHFIGGQDIEGPVMQLQNALSYNYYANSSIYTPSTQTAMPTYNPQN